jgi:hypothetical protein
MTRLLSLAALALALSACADADSLRAQAYWRPDQTAPTCARLTSGALVCEIPAARTAFAVEPVPQFLRARR